MPLRFFVVLLIAAVFLRAGDDFTRKQYISKKINKKKTSLNILALAGVSLVPAFLFAAGSKNKNFKNEAYTSGVVVSIPVALGWTLFFREMHTFHQRKAAAVSAVQSEEVRLKIKGKVNDELSNAVICRAVFKAFPVEDLSQSVITDPRDGS
ncbi:MAG TPA: hypothetical protein VKS21_10110, partial [Spirochaetota bacterium]|nr:hypothetical protein [Spirochaetota bacterium]